MAKFSSAESPKYTYLARTTYSAAMQTPLHQTSQLLAVQSNQQKPEKNAIGERAVGCMLLLSSAKPHCDRWVHLRTNRGITAVFGESNAINTFQTYTKSWQFYIFTCIKENW